MMTDERLLTLIAAYGADPAAYPEAEQADARALLLAMPELFSDAIDDEQSLDALFADLPDIMLSDAFEAELIAAGPTPVRVKSSVRRWRFQWPAIGGALASLAVGLIAGLSVAAPASASDTSAEEVDTLVMAALGMSEMVLMQESDYE